MLVDLSYNLDDIAPAKNVTKALHLVIDKVNKLFVCGKMIFWSSYRNK